MERHDVVTEVVLDTVRVPLNQVGDIDPLGDAVEVAQRTDTKYDSRVDSYFYEPIEKHDHVLVLVEGVIRDSGRRQAQAIPPREDFEGGPEIISWRNMNVAEALADQMTVAELRDLRKQTGASFKRGSTKEEMAEQLVEQAPETAYEAVGQ